MTAALETMPLDARERTALQNFFEHTSAALVNVAWRGHSCPPRRHSCRRLVCFTRAAQAHIGHPELEKRWASQQTVEHAIEATPKPRLQS
jgi:hypothetical protein